MYNKNNEHGFTLIEILAVLVLSSIILVFCGTYLVNAMSNYERIQTDVTLRDEADLMMAMFLKDLYRIETVYVNDTPSCQATNNCLPDMIYICEKQGNTVIEKQIGFQGQTVYTTTGEYTIENDNIELVDYEIKFVEHKGQTEPDLDTGEVRDRLLGYTYEVSFELKHLISNKSVKYDNAINIINTGEKGSKCTTN